MAMRKAGFVAVAATAAVLLIVAAPSLLARGGGGGGRGGAGDGTDINGDGGGQNLGNTTGPAGNIGNAPGDKGVGPDGDGRRDGAEQDAIARDALDGRGRADFRALRDERNRSSVEPVRGSDRR